MFLLALVACAPAEVSGVCGEGRWGHLDAPGAWWVDPLAEPGGDGTRDRPIRSLSMVPEGGHALLAAGEHTVPSWRLSGTWEGVCAERTLLER